MFRDKAAIDIDQSDFTSGGTPLPTKPTSKPDTFKPEDYDTQFTGGAGSDAKDGTAGRDWIDGRGGNDRINGKAGDDYIIAGTGKDSYVQGGTGADIFQFSKGDGDVRIFDWEDGIDGIHLAGGLAFSDLTQSTKSYNGIVTVVFSTDTGDRLMFHDELASNITAGDFA